LGIKLEFNSNSWLDIFEPLMSPSGSLMPQLAGIIDRGIYQDSTVNGSRFKSFVMILLKDLKVNVTSELDLYLEITTVFFII